MTFDIAQRFRPDLPPPEAPWTDPPRYSFVGGHNDPGSVPFAGLAEAATSVLRREGERLATYNLGGSPLGYRPLRELVSRNLAARAGLNAAAEQVLITSGSLQALDLVNTILLEPGDTVIVEQATYGGMISRLQALGVTIVGVDVDRDGLDTDHLGRLLDRGVRPKFIYTIPTVQNPTGTVMTVERRLRLLELARDYGVPIFEDDCYADLLWGQPRPPSIRALDEEGTGGQVIYCGSFSKSIAPALRVGYLVADESVLAQMSALKTDAGTGALEQLVLAEYGASHFDGHVEQLVSVLHAKCAVMAEAVSTELGSTATFDSPQGGIFIWLTFPEGFDTGALAGPARAAGVEFNPGAGWSADPVWGARRLRLCFGQPSHDVIREGVAALADAVKTMT